MKSAPLGAVALILATGCAEAPLETTLQSGTLESARPALQFTTVEVPGALLTSAFGIGQRGEIVGFYVDESFVFHGYLLRDGVFSTIDFPGAEGTQPRGIGPSGEIVGTYWLPGEPGLAAHGFLLTPDGTYHTADYPGHLYTIAQRILPDGSIVGCRHDNDTMGSMKGVAMTRAGNSEIDAFASMHNGATPSMKLIVGLHTNLSTSRVEGYVIEDGSFTSFVVPGSNMTQAWDVNPAGSIVGLFRNSTGVHGFLRRGDEYVTLDYPGASITRAFGINARGDIVGNYVLGGKTYAFLATTTPRANR